MQKQKKHKAAKCNANFNPNLFNKCFFFSILKYNSAARNLGSFKFFCYNQLWKISSSCETRRCL